MGFERTNCHEHNVEQISEKTGTTDHYRSETAGLRTKWHVCHSPYRYRGRTRENSIEFHYYHLIAHSITRYGTVPAWLQLGRYLRNYPGRWLLGIVKCLSFVIRRSSLNEFRIRMKNIERE